MMQRVFRVAFVGALGISLSGCIAAAAAIPVLAGGGMVGSRVIDDDRDRAEPTAIPLPPFERTSGTAVAVAESAEMTEGEPEALVDPTPAATLAQSAPGALPAIDTPPALEPPMPEPVAEQPDPALSATQSVSVPVVTSAAAPGTLAPVELTLPDGSRIALTGDSATGIQTGAAASASVASGPVRDAASETVVGDAYRPLQTFMSARADTRLSDDPRKSALLAVPAALEPVTTRCAVSQPAVVIDLDPGDAPLDTSASYAPNPELAKVLSELRTRNVSVHWISGNSAAEAGAIRRLLDETGLDPRGTDELVLMRYPDDRKQTRRRAVGATHCLLAIAGDQRRDFDELYAFLKNPDEAVALERLVGDGWFLIPPALSPVDQ